MPQVDFWYDFGSSYSYPAVMRAAGEAGKRGVTLVWRPFLLGPIFAARGYRTSPFRADPVKGDYSWRDLTRICAKYGLPFGKPPGFPQIGLLPARVTLALDEAARPDFTRAAFSAQFGEGKLVSEPAVIEAVLSKLGHAPAELLAKAHTDDIKLTLRRETEQAEKTGIFGAPFFVTEDGELFWGHDRMEDAFDWAIAHA